MSYTRGANPIWFMNNLTGQPLDDSYYAFFLTNDLPYVPQAVYQDPNGLVPWSDPIEFQPSAGLPNNLYFNDDLVYRIEIRQGDTQAFPLIYLIENYQPGIGGGNIDNEISFSENLVTNPQFIDVFFDGTITFDTAGTYNIAPGWDLVLSGAGTTTITQEVNPGQGYNTSLSPFAPYYLTFNNSGWTEVILRQTFAKNGAIFDGGAIGAAFSAFVQGDGKRVTVSYVPSSPPGGAGNVSILSPLVATGVLTQFGGYANVGVSQNTDTGDDSFVNLEFTLPPSAIISLTNISFTGQNAPLVEPINIPDPIFEQQTYEREVDHTFNVYRDSLVRESKGNLLTGWTFGLNPYQFINPNQALVTVKTQYIADQTILHQETASALKTGRGDASINFGLNILSVNGVNANRFAIIQYIDYSTVCAYFGQVLSSMARAAIATTNSTQTKLKMRLIYRTAGDAIPMIGDNEPITGWDVNGNVQFATGWTAIAPANDVDYLLLARSGQNFPMMPFDKIQLPIASSATPYLGVVFYITAPLNNALGSEDSITFDRISLINNDFAMDVEAETYDETFRKCQFYFEKSYDDGVNIGTATRVGAYYYSFPAVTNVSGTVGYPKSINLQYKQVKRTASSIRKFYSTINANTVNAVTVGTLNGGGGDVVAANNISSTTWSLENESDHGMLMIRNTLASIGSPSGPGQLDYESYQTFQYTIDARLGAF